MNGYNYVSFAIKIIVWKIKYIKTPLKIWNTIITLR